MHFLLCLSDRLSPLSAAHLALLSLGLSLTSCATLSAPFSGRAALPPEGPAAFQRFDHQDRELWTVRAGQQTAMTVPAQVLEKPGVPSIWPVAEKGRELLSPYGARRRGFHHGLDIRNPQGAPVFAAAAGKVTEVGFERNWGKFVTLEHAEGIATRYAHLHSTSVQEGETVRQGATIGTVGKTGNASTPHLHYEVLVSGKPTDPVGYLP